MKKLGLFIALLIATGSLLSCKKEVPYAEVGTTEITIVFSSPVAGETTNGSQEVSVEARVEANAMMSGYRVTITNSSTGELLDSIDDLYEQTQYMVHHHWYPSTSQVVPVNIKIEALDQNMGVLGSDSLQITCAP